MSRTNPLLKGLNVGSNNPDPTGHLAELLEQPTVVITGSRACTTYGERVAEELATLLAYAGATLITGGAYGIDAAALRATVASGGKAIVVLANGLDKFYPSGNARLLMSVVETGGVLVSAYEEGDLPSRTRFQERTRLMMSAADAVIIPEAATRSSALAGLAEVTDVPAYAVPGPVTSAQSCGPHSLIKSGRAKLLTPVAEDISELLAAVAR